MHTTPSTPYSAPPAPVQTQPKVSGFAITALVLGCVGSILGWLYVIPPVLAIIFGGLAIHKIQNSNGWLTGKGMAIAGLVLGVVFTAIYGLIFLVALGST